MIYLNAISMFVGYAAVTYIAVKIIISLVTSTFRAAHNAVTLIRNGWPRHPWWVLIPTCVVLAVWDEVECAWNGLETK